MMKIRVGTIVMGAILALTATAFAHVSADQAGMSAQQSQPSMPGQQSQPASPGTQAQPPSSTMPQQPGATQNAPVAAPTSSAADAVANRLAQALNLNDAQTTKVKSALEDERTQLVALRDNTSMSAQDKQAKLMDIRQTASTKIMSILTPDQQKKLADLVQKQQQQQNQPAAPQPAQPPK